MALRAPGPLSGVGGLAAVILALAAAAVGGGGLDVLLASCAAQERDYRQALANDRPPEIVELSLGDLLSAMRDLPSLSEAEIVRRRALETVADRETLRADPALVEAGRLRQCLADAELRRRALDNAGRD